jgi:hypothetical protein
VRHAVDEFVGRVGCRMTYNLNGHAVLVKDGAGN